jgi:delta8-fatty-acid desaturase
MAEVAEHNKREDCWIILDERVYDITKFVDRHPGGVGPVANMAGKDATDVFDNYHQDRVYRTMLSTYLIGECTDVVVYPHVADFRAARQQMLEDGLFQTDYTWYAKLGVWLAGLFFSSLGLSLGLIGGGSTFARMVGAAIMGVFWQQLAGLGHDLGHSAVTHDFHTDHKIGSCLSALMGLSVGWWKSDHNTHHVVCNAVEHDPNIQHMPILAITDKIYEKPFYDTYHKKIVSMDAIARFLVSHQHFIFYPFMLIARFNLYAQVCGQKYSQVCSFFVQIFCTTSLTHLIVSIQGLIFLLTNHDKVSNYLYDLANCIHMHAIDIICSINFNSCVGRLFTFWL